MRIRARQSGKGTPRLVLNLASMIDVVFLLLIYFMITIAVWTPEDRLNSALHVDREAAAGSATDFQPQIVDVMLVDGAPAYMVGTRVFRDQPSLTAALTTLNKSAGLFVRVRDEPPVDAVMVAFQAGHDAGFTKLTYVPR
jgi:biopolymer transport protein ExbD